MEKEDNLILIWADFQIPEMSYDTWAKSDNLCSQTNLASTQFKNLCSKPHLSKTSLHLWVNQLLVTFCFMCSWNLSRACSWSCSWAHRHKISVLCSWRGSRARAREEVHEHEHFIQICILEERKILWRKCGEQRKRSDSFQGWKEEERTTSSGAWWT